MPEILQVERGKIIEVLHKELRDEEVEIHFGKKYIFFIFLHLLRLMPYRCVGFEEEQDGVTVKFEEGQTVRCDILIAADGSRSAVRKQMNFPGDKQEYTGGILFFFFFPIVSLYSLSLLFVLFT